MATHTTKIAGLAILAVLLLAAPTAAAEHADIDQVATQENIQRIVQESIVAESEQIGDQVSEQVILQHAIVAQQQDDEAELTDGAEEALEDQLGDQDEADLGDQPGEDEEQPVFTEEEEAEIRGISREEAETVFAERNLAQDHELDLGDDTELGDVDESEESPLQDDEDMDESEDDAQVSGDVALRLALLEQEGQELDERVTDLEHRVQVLEALKEAQEQESLDGDEDDEEQNGLLDLAGDGGEATGSTFSVASSHMSQPGSQDATPGFAVVDAEAGDLQEDEDQEDLPQTRILTPNRFGEGALLQEVAEGPPQVDTNENVRVTVSPGGEFNQQIDFADAEADQDPFAGPATGATVVNVEAPQQPGAQAPQVTVNVQNEGDRPFTEFGNLPEDATVMENQPGEADDVDQAAQDLADAVRADAMARVNAELGGDAQMDDAQQMGVDTDGDGTVDMVLTPAEDGQNDEQDTGFDEDGDEGDEAEPFGDQDEVGPVDEGEQQEGSLVGTGAEGQLGVSSDAEDFEFDPEGGEGGWWGDEGFWP